MRKYTVALALCGVGLVSAATATGGSARHHVARQRIAIEERFNIQTGTGTFVVYPLTPGPLKYDKGTVKGYGAPKGTVLQNGMKVELLAGADNCTGKLGTFQIAGSVAHVEVQFGTGLANDVGTWSIVKGSGAYRGFKGGGRTASVLIGAILDTRNEGWVSG